MRITGLRAWPVTMRLEEPYAIAYDTLAATTNVFVALATDGPITGYGCAAPDEHVTGETPETVLKALSSVAEPVLRGADPLRAALLLEELRVAAANVPAALAAIDMALADILGKQAGVPVWKLLGGYRDRIRTSVTIGILPEAETVALARHWAGRGFSALKLKGGLDAEADAARVCKVREAVGGGVSLRFDANQGYTVEQALRFAERARVARLEMLEQPTPQAQPELLGQVARNTAVPIMADESLLSLADAYRLARDGLVGMFNVKLVKVGGIAEGLKISAVARAAGIEVMAGCMDESALGIAAGLHFALADSQVRYADLDGHLGLQGDPAAGAVLLRDGTLFPTELPGLGYKPPQ